MAKLVEVQNTLDGNNVHVFPKSLPVKAGAVESIKVGYLVREDDGNEGYWKAAADADTSVLFLKGGVAVTASTDTASVDGEVNFKTAPVLLVKMKAKTPANLVATMLNNKFILDVTAGNYTLDQATTTNGFLTLLDYDNTTDGNCLVAINCGW